MAPFAASAACCREHAGHEPDDVCRARLTPAAVLLLLLPLCLKQTGDQAANIRSAPAQPLPRLVAVARPAAALQPCKVCTAASSATPAGVKSCQQLTAEAMQCMYTSTPQAGLIAYFLSSAREDGRKQLVIAYALTATADAHPMFQDGGQRFALLLSSQPEAGASGRVLMRR